MTDVINKIFTTGKCPNHFKTAIIKPIYKKGDKLLMENYRPISLTTTLSKIFEKATKERLVTYLTKYILLSKKQFGFRKNTSTNNAMASLTDRIYRALDDKKPAIGVFIDLAKAFDTICHKRLLKKK